MDDALQIDPMQLLVIDGQSAQYIHNGALKKSTVKMMNEQESTFSFRRKKSTREELDEVKKHGKNMRITGRIF